MRNGEWGTGKAVGSVRAHCAPASANPHSPFRFPHSRTARVGNPASRRLGISLLEVLISMFVLLFGLLGVASMFPVGNHYAARGETYDRIASAAPAAFAELKTRGILRPANWLYSPPPNYALSEAGLTTNSNRFYPVMNPGTQAFTFPFAAPADFHPGHAFMIDPLGAAEAAAATDQVAHFFPYAVYSDQYSSAQAAQPNTQNPWSRNVLPGEQWPIRRLSLAQLNPGGNQWQIMSKDVAETIVRLRDDLADTLPEDGDKPGQALWKVDNNGNPLSRQYDGAYSWLATVVPTAVDGLAALQPGHIDYGSVFYDVSIAMFYRRDEAPSAESERSINAEMFLGGELAIYANANAAGVEAVNNALKDIRTGQWIAVCGVDQTTGQFILKWYRTLSIQDEISNPSIDTITLANNNVVTGRMLMLDGPDWPLGSMQNLRAILMPGCVGVATRPMKMETDSLWSAQ